MLNFDDYSPVSDENGGRTVTVYMRAEDWNELLRLARKAQQMEEAELRLTDLVRTEAHEESYR